MLRCDKTVMEICENSTKKRTFSGNFGQSITKISAIVQQNFTKNLTEFLRKFSEKFVEISAKLLEMNVAKIFREFQINPE